MPTKIGIFDSGYGGLSILREIRRRLPEYDYLYLGDNARAPYGSRSFEVVYDFTLEAVKHLFAQGCPLVVLACNTASAKALRSIQQHDLPMIAPANRVLGVIRPTVEALGDFTRTRHVGVLATEGTVLSHSYRMEIEKLYPDMKLTEQSCPLWVPLIENGESDGPGADYFVKKYIDTLMSADPAIDTIVLGCTHYPLLLPKIEKYIPDGVKVLPQGNLVAGSLADYLRRHTEIDSRLSKGETCEYLTTENPDKFDAIASLFISDSVRSEKVQLS